MTKIVRVAKLLIAAIGICITLSSCIYIYYPMQDYSKMVSKTSIKDFSSLNNPVVIPMVAEKSFNSKKDKTGYTSNIECGYINIVYDWETDTVYDWIYDEKYQGLQNGLYSKIESDGVVKYLGYRSSANNLIEFTSNAPYFREVAQQEKYDIYGAVGDTSCYSSRYGVFIENDRDNSNASGKNPFEKKITIWDSKTDTISKTLTFRGNSDDPDVPVCDPDGNYWIYYVNGDSEKKENVVIRKIDVARNKLEEPIATFDYHNNSTYDSADGWPDYEYFKICFVDSDYVVLNAVLDMDGSRERNRMIFIDRNTKSQDSIDLPRINGIAEACYKIGSKYYVVTSENDNVRFVEIDKETGTAILLPESYKTKNGYISNIFARNSKIYLTVTDDESVNLMNFVFYDVSSGKIENCETFCPSEK